MELTLKGYNALYQVLFSQAETLRARDFPFPVPTKLFTEVFLYNSFQDFENYTHWIASAD